MRIPTDVLNEFGLEAPKEKVEVANMSTKDRNAYISNSSPDNPVYMRISLMRHAYNQNTMDYEDVLTPDVLVAVEGTKQVQFEENKYHTYEQTCANCTIIEDSAADKFGHVYKAGSMLHTPVDELQIQETLDRTPELDEKLQSAIDGVEWKVKGVIYPEANVSGLTELEKHSVACKMEPIVTHEYELKGFRQIDDVEKWMIENHPEEFIGMSCSSNTGSVSFSAIPSAYSEDDSWSTYAGREQIVRDRAARLGCEVGSFDYSAVEPDDYNMKALKAGFAKAKEEMVSEVSLKTNDNDRVRVLIGYDALSDSHGRSAYMVQSEDMISYTEQLYNRELNGSLGTHTDRGIMVTPEQLMRTVHDDMEHWDEIRTEDARLKTELATRYFEQIKPQIDAGTLSSYNDPNNAYEVFSDAHRELYGNKLGSGAVDGFGPNIKAYSKSEDGSCVMFYTNNGTGPQSATAKQVQDYCQLMKMENAYFVSDMNGANGDSYICYRGAAKDIESPYLRQVAQSAAKYENNNMMKQVPVCDVDDKYLGISRPEPQPDKLKMYTMVTETARSSGRLLVATEDEIRPGDVHAVENFLRNEHGYSADSKVKVQFDTIHEVDRFTAYDGYIIDDDTHVFRRGEATPTRTLGDYGGEKGLLKDYKGLTDDKPAQTEEPSKSDKIDYKNDVVIRNVKTRDTKDGLRARIPYSDSPSGYATVAVAKCEPSGKQGKELYNITMATPNSGSGKGKVSVYYRDADGNNVWDKQFPDVVRDKSQKQRDSWKAANDKKTSQQSINEALAKVPEDKIVDESQKSM